MACFVAAIGAGGVIGVTAYEQWIGPLLGQLPNPTGINIANQNRALIVNASPSGVPPIILAAGIAVQSEGTWKDQFKGPGSSKGIAAMTPAEKRFFPGGVYSPGDDIASIYAMGNKIAEQVNTCDPCSVGDKYVVAALAQNGFPKGTVTDLLRTYGNNGRIDWNGYFNSIGTSNSIPDQLRRVQMAAVGIKDWNRFQVWVFAVQLEELMRQGWTIDDPNIIPYLKCIAQSGSNCSSP